MKLYGFIIAESGFVCQLNYEIYFIHPSFLTVFCERLNANVFTLLLRRDTFIGLMLLQDFFLIFLFDNYPPSMYNEIK